MSCDADILTNVTLQMLNALARQCDYSCSCSHGRCSHYPKHDYFDMEQLNKMNEKLNGIGVEVIVLRDRKAKSVDLKFVYPKLGTEQKLVDVFKVCVNDSYLGPAGVRQFNVMLAGLTIPLIIIDKSLYRAVLLA